MHKALVLDDDQKKALAQLKRAFTACAKAKIEIHGELTTLYALNGRHMSGSRVAAGVHNEDDDESITIHAESIDPKCFYGCSADDGLSIVGKNSPRKIKYKDDGDED